MNDPRTTAANGRVAARELEGIVAADRYTAGCIFGCRMAVTSLLASPKGVISCQLLFGEAFRVLECRDGWAFGQAAKDNYVGYVPVAHLQPFTTTQFWVSSLGTHVYSRNDIKSAVKMALPFGARIAGRALAGGFVEFRGIGYVPSIHLNGNSEYFDDYVSVAEEFTGVPYLWGGNSPWGVDCSGLVQCALAACGRRVPRDSDMQFARLGRTVCRSEGLARGDLAFWKGHVGIMLGRQMLLHANAHTLSVAAEPLDEVCSRLEESGQSPLLGFRRI